MTTPLAQLPYLAFNGVKFPISKLTMHGSIRDHTHEFWKRPGAMPEKGGRKPYTVTVTAMFHTTIKNFGKLFPDKMLELRGLFEKQTTATLVVPHVGSVQMYAADWSESLDPHMQSGMNVDITFKEDTWTMDPRVNVSVPLDDAIIKYDFYAAALKSDIEFLKQEEQDADAFYDVHKTRPILANEPRRVGSLLDAISGTARFIQSVKDQWELYSTTIVTRVKSCAESIQEIERMLTGMDERSNACRQAMLDLQAALVEIARDVQQKTAVIRPHTVLRTCTLPELSIAIFGTSSHAVDLLALNDIPDALKIPAGTIVRYYDVVD